MIRAKDDVVVEELVPGALLHHAAQQLAQGQLLFGTEHAEHFFVCGNRVADHRGRDSTAFASQVGPQNPPMLRILFSFHQTAAFERGERELNPLRTDQQSSGKFGAGQAGFVRQLAQHPDLRRATTA